MSTGMVYEGRYRRAGVHVNQPDLTGDAAKAAFKKIRTEIIDRFKNGQPFFTKDGLRVVRDQINRLTKKEEKIIIKGLDGVPVEFFVETGRVFQHNHDNHTVSNTEFVCTKPFISYVSFQKLIQCPNPPLVDPHVAYCNMVISHQSVSRDIKTREMIKEEEPAEFVKQATSQFLEQVLHAWESSVQCQSLLAILKSKQKYFAGGVSNIVAFGCGSFIGSRDDENTRAAYQHASLLTIRRFLSDELGYIDGVKILAQDPAYTATDKELLQEWKITTVDDPDGFLELDDRSIVLTCSPTAPIKQIVTDICKPLMMICDTVVTRDDPNLFDPDSPRIRILIACQYDIIDFPQDPLQLGHEDNFGPLSIYVRRPEH